MERKFVDLGTYNPHHIRGIADALTKKYQDLDPRHVFWIAKKLNIYPDAKTYGGKEWVYMTKMGKINKNTGYVADGNRAHLTDSAIKVIEDYLITEGYETYNENKEEKMTETKSIWEQADLISQMKNEYEKVVQERDNYETEASQYCALAEQYSKDIEELKDKLLIYEKENNDLKAEKQQLAKMQIDIPNFNKEIDGLQERIGKYNSEINIYMSEVNMLRKDLSALQNSVNRLQDQKKRLEGVVSDLIGCSKRLMNMK